jgi:hypothetical protein
MRIIETFEQFRVNESLSSAKRYLMSGQIDSDTLERLKALDPTPTFKYLDRMIWFYLNQNIQPMEMASVIKEFDRLSKGRQLPNPDIKSYSDWDYLKDVVSKFGRIYDRKLGRKNIINVYEDENYWVFIPVTHEAHCKYGTGTKWCTNERDSDENFNIYINERRATIYFILDKKANISNRHYKLQVTIYPNGEIECADSQAVDITFDQVINMTRLNPNLFVWRWDEIYNT